MFSNKEMMPLAPQRAIVSLRDMFASYFSSCISVLEVSRKVTVIEGDVGLGLWVSGWDASGTRQHCVKKQLEGQIIHRARIKVFLFI